MFSKMFGKIFGVPDKPATEAKLSRSAMPSPSLDLYRPESQVPDNGIDAVAEDGSVWAFWRTDADGQRWFQKLSADQVTEKPPLRAFEPVTEDDGDDVFSDDSCGELELFTTDDYTDGINET